MFNQAKSALIITTIAIFGSLTVLAYFGVIIADNYVNSPLVSVEVETEQARGAGTSANFTVSPKPDNPLQINFTDQSLGDIAKWNWDFGDGALPLIFSSEQKGSDTLIGTSLQSRHYAVLENSENIIFQTAFEGSLDGDLNNNGINDPLLLYYDIFSKTAVNTMAIVNNEEPTIVSCDDMVPLITNEHAAQKDFNGDGKFSNDIVMYFDIRENKVVSTGAEGNRSFNPSCAGNIIAFITHEVSINEDLDGDGLKESYVVRYFDRATEKVFGTKGKIFSAGHPSVLGNIIIFPTFEAERPHIDLNEDGDFNDVVLRYFDIASNSLVNTKAEMAGPKFSIYGNKIAFISPEKNIGPLGSDLNGDGDKLDNILRYFDVPSATIVNTGSEAYRGIGELLPPAINEHLIAFVTQEISVGQTGEDLNGDGDKNDDTLRYYDLSTKKTTNTRAEIYSFPSVSGRRVAFITEETSVGRNGEDLNKDGDMYFAHSSIPDRVLRYFDVSTGSLYNTEAEAQTPYFSGDVIAFQTSEKSIGSSGLDFTENNSIEDRIMRYFVINGTPFANGSTSHIYNKPGTYTAILTVTDKNGVTSSATKDITVGQIIPLPVSSFTAVPTSGLAPLTVQFTDTSTNSPTSWQWDFDNNGSVDSVLQNPTHTYVAPGTYTVSLTVANQAGSNTKTMSDYITVTQPNRNPILNPIGDKIIDEGQLLSFTISATDLDGDALTYSADGLPSGASFNFSTRVFSWTPDSTQGTQDYSVTFNVYDGKGGFDSEIIKITVNDVVIPPTYQCSDGLDNDNDGKIDLSDPGCSSLIDDDETDIPHVDTPPVACIVNPDQTVEEGTTVILDGSCSYDIDNDSLSYQWTQTAGITVGIVNPDGPIASFIAPKVVVVQNNDSSLYAAMASSIQIIIEFLKSIFAEEIPNQEILTFQLIVTANNKPSFPDSAQITVKPRSQPVSLIIVNPQDNQLVSPRQKLLIQAQAEPSVNNGIARVAFFIYDKNNNLIKQKTDKRSPYQFNWTVPRRVKPGDAYQIQAQAYGKDNTIVAKSERVRVMVR